MSTRLKSGLSLLLMTLVFVASSQAVVCELTCGLDASSAGCHRSEAHSREAVESSTMPAMPHNHCARSMHEGGGHERSGVLAKALSFTGAKEMQCPHNYAPAIEGLSGASFHLAAIHWTVFEVVPVAITLPGARRASLQPPPSLSASRSSILVTLRV